MSSTFFEMFLALACGVVLVFLVFLCVFALVYLFFKAQELHQKISHIRRYTKIQEYANDIR